MRSLDSYAELLRVIAERGAPTVERAEGGVGYGRQEGTTVARFSDGSRVEIGVDYEPNYSELTPGAGWQTFIWLYEAGE